MESSSAPAMKTATATTAMEAPTAPAVESATATAAVEATASTAMTAALCECGIGRESKTGESSERDEGPNLTKYAHNLTFPSSVVTDFQLQSLRVSSSQILVVVHEEPRKPVLLAETATMKDAAGVPMVG